MTSLYLSDCVKSGEVVNLQVSLAVTRVNEFQKSKDLSLFIIFACICVADALVWWVMNVAHIKTFVNWEKTHPTWTYWETLTEMLPHGDTVLMLMIES